MKIALINGSPKANGSVSALILQSLRERFPDHQEQRDDGACCTCSTCGSDTSGACGTCINTYHFSKPQINQQDLAELAACDTLVFAFPLYVDGIPSHLLSCLSQMEGYLKPLASKEMRVYAIVNCGFYEGRQNQHALDMMQNWCAKTRLIWGHGLGIGGGGSQAAIPETHPLKKGFSAAMNNMANYISNGRAADHAFIDPAIPRILYKIGGAMGWRQQIKVNGLKVRDLSLRK
jgi:multimeric flavodoxin WrbA